MAQRKCILRAVPCRLGAWEEDASSKLCIADCIGHDVMMKALLSS